MPTNTFLNLTKEKQERVLSAAVEEFRRCNIEDSSLSNIVKRAGIPRGSLYQYFIDKEDLYVYCFTVLRAQRADYVKPAFELYKKEPFIRFFEEFHIRDSEFLLRHQAHIEMGKNLYGHTSQVSMRIINSQRVKYRDLFLIAIEHDKALNRISEKTNSGSLADLCVHFVTDIFIFESIMQNISIASLREYTNNMLSIIEHGISPSEELQSLP